MYDNNFSSWLLYMSDVRHCRKLLRAGSRSFYAASLLLPQSYRMPIIALYAFCRVADDEIDAHGVDATALAALKSRLHRIYSRSPDDNPVDRAFADVTRIYEIPEAIPAALLEGFAWDINGRDYESMSNLYAYSARVAGTVGTMMAMIMGVRDPVVLSRACDLGVAMQITNIARDVGEDAGAGRLYLPRELLQEQGVDADEFLRRPRFSPGVARVVEQILCAADRLYDRADWGLAMLPAACRPGMFAASSIYREIGNEVRRNNYDSVSCRAHVSGKRKLGLLAAATRDAWAAHDKDDAPTLPEVRFLIDAVSST
jgi:phytoene synthase